MTVSSTKSSETFACNGVTTVFVAPFRVLEATSVQGFLITIATGASAPLVNGTDFTVSGVGDANTSVTTAVAYSSAYRFHVKRITPRLQETDYRDNDPFPAESHEACLDRLTHITQEDAETLSRALVWPDGETAPVMPSQADRANKVWANNAAGDLVFVVPTDGSVGSFAIDLASDASAIKGAGMVGLGASLNYAVGTLGYWVTRVVTDFNVFRWIPPTEWAAILDGTSTYDAASAWASAINAAIASGRPATVSGPTGRYYLASVIGDFTGNDITIDGNGSTFDCAGIPTGVVNYVLRFSGTYSGAPVALTANAAAVQKTVACASGTFAVGDMVRVYSNAVWDPARTGTRYGELNFVETIPDSASVTLTQDTASAYNTADLAKIEKVTPCRDITLKNVKILGPAANDVLFCMRFTLCTGLVVQGVRSYDFDTCHLQLVDCSGAKITGNHFEESNSAGIGYGCSVADATQDCIVSSNTFRNVRHSLATNNNVAASWGITRRIKFLGNIVDDSATSTGGVGGDAIDNHAGSEDISIEGNIVFASSGSAIISEGRTAIIKGNEIYACQGNAITHQNYTALLGEAHISGNTIRSVVGAYGIAIVAQGAGYKSWSVNDNNINVTARCLQLIGAPGKELNKGAISGNTLVSTVTLQAVNVEYANYVGMSGGSIEAPSIGTQWENCSYIDVVGVPVELNGAVGLTGYGHRFQGAGEGNTVGLCSMRHSGAITNAAAVSFVDATITQSQIRACSARGFTSVPVYRIGTGTGNVESLNLTY